MNIVKNVDQYDHSNVYYCDPIKNNIMNEGTFTRILYSTNLFVLNGITLFMMLNEVNIEKYYNKYKCSFNTNLYKDLIDKLKYIEEELLENVNISNKTPQYKIHEQLRNGNIKIFVDSDNKNITNLIMLKISGIWETDIHYGLTYKFLQVNHP